MNTRTLLGRQRPCLTTARSSGGFALIEALIAILIFSIAVLGLVGLQVSMSSAQTSAKFRADAALLADDLIGTMWTDAANRGSYLNANCATYAPCQNWQKRLNDILPGSTPDIANDSTTGGITITINWQMPNEGKHRFVTSTIINPS